MRKYFRVRQALEKLKSEFSYTELIDAMASVGIGMSTAKRYRIRLLKMGIIVKEGENYRFTHRKWRSKLEKSSLGKV
jgi:hypothetical protein